MSINKIVFNLYKAAPAPKIVSSSFNFNTSTSDSLEKTLDTLHQINKARTFCFDIASLKKDVEAFIAKETDPFWEKFRTTKEIDDFELCKSIVSLVNDNNPKDCSLTNRQYYKILQYVKENGLSKNSLEKAFSGQEELFDELKIIAQEERGYSFLNDLFFNQKANLNPDLEKIKQGISPSIAQIDRIETVPAELKSVLQKSKGLTLDVASLIEQKYSESNPYDLPLKFASSCYNTLNQKGSAYIKQEIPEIFEGIDEKELFEALDTLTLHTRNNQYKTFPNGSKINIKIKNKNYTLTALNSGIEGSVYRIEGDNKKPVIFKNYYAESDYTTTSGVGFAPMGLYGNLSVLMEANNEKVSDTVKLYIANPIFKPVKYNSQDKFLGGWTIVEDAKAKEPSKEGLKFLDWLNEKGLLILDSKSDAWVNGYCIDTGAVTSKSNSPFFSNGWAKKEINELYSNYLNGKTTDEIIEMI